MFGLMDNNIGFHKERLALRPQLNHPEINTADSLVNFFLSAFNSICSRSVLVLVRGLISTMNDFISRFASVVPSSNSLLPNFLMSNSSVTFSNNLNIFITTIFNSLLNIFYTFILFITNLNLSNLYTNMSYHISFLLSFNAILGLNDLQFGY